MPKDVALIFSTHIKSLAWWHAFVIPVLGRLRSWGGIALGLTDYLEYLISELQVTVRGPVSMSKVMVIE